MSNRPIYKLVDSKGRVLIPKNLREAAKMEYGDIVRLRVEDGSVSVCKVDIIEEMCIRDRPQYQTGGCRQLHIPASNPIIKE